MRWRACSARIAALSAYFQFSRILSMTTGVSNENLLYFALGGTLVYVGVSLMRRKAPSKIISPQIASPVVDTTPKWRPGQNQPMPSPSKEWKTYTPSDLKAPGSLYHLVISSIVPRPIALVTSHDQHGTLNCAPFSYFNILSHDPPILAIGCCMNMRAKTKKDTLNNIEATGQFVVNIMSSWYLESANHTCGAFPPEVNELEEAGLTTVPSVNIKPPRVAEAAVQLECETYMLHPLENPQKQHSATIVMGRIVRFHVHESVLTDSSTDAKPVVDWEKLRAVGRLGGDIFTLVNNGQDMPRPEVSGGKADRR